MKVLAYLIAIIFGYLVGSISNGVIIGYIVKGVDIRTLGSGNSGGTNTGRVLGKKWGLLTIFLDMIKTVVSVWVILFVFRIESVNLVFDVNPSTLSYLSGLACCLGHSYPIFFNFKGGKIISCGAGLLIATNWILLIIALLTFFIVLLITKYVSLSSICAASMFIIFAFIPILKYGMVFNNEYNLVYSIVLCLIGLFAIYRHHANIKRLLNHTESKVTWLGGNK